LLILEAVGLIPKSNATKAVLTSYTVFQECTRSTVDAVLASFEAIAFMNIHAVVTPFRVKVIKTINTSNVFLEPISIHALIAEICMTE
jgi:hypothetical protein